MPPQRWLGLSEQGSVTDKWIVPVVSSNCRYGASCRGGRSPTGVTPHIGGQIHAAIFTGRLSKYVSSGVLAAGLECGLFPL